MKISRGFVFIPLTEHFRSIFGKSVNVSRRYENIETNDFSLFKQKFELDDALNEFRRLSSNETLSRSATLEMQIAETQEEADKFTNGNLVVIYDRSILQGNDRIYTEKTLYGPRIKGKPSDFNGVCAKLGFNGFKTFYWLGDCYKPQTAKYAAKETHRQGDSAPVTLAKFKLKFLEE